jgi:hypothetical protein
MAALPVACGTGADDRCAGARRRSSRASCRPTTSRGAARTRARPRAASAARSAFHSEADRLPEIKLKSALCPILLARRARSRPPRSGRCARAPPDSRLQHARRRWAAHPLQHIAACVVMKAQRSKAACYCLHRRTAYCLRRARSSLHVALLGHAACRPAPGTGEKGGTAHAAREAAPDAAHEAGGRAALRRRGGARRRRGCARSAAALATTRTRPTSCASTCGTSTSARRAHASATTPPPPPWPPPPPPTARTGARGARARVEACSTRAGAPAGSACGAMHAPWSSRTWLPLHVALPPRHVLAARPTLFPYCNGKQQGGALRRCRAAREWHGRGLAPALWLPALHRAAAPRRHRRPGPRRAAATARAAPQRTADPQCSQGGPPERTAALPDRRARARRGARREVKVLPRSVLAGSMPSGRPEPGVPRRRRKGAAKGADAASCGPLWRAAPAAAGLEHVGAAVRPRAGSGASNGERGDASGLHHARLLRVPSSLLSLPWATSCGQRAGLRVARGAGLARCALQRMLGGAHAAAARAGCCATSTSARACATTAAACLRTARATCASASAPASARPGGSSTLAFWR